MKLTEAQKRFLRETATGKNNVPGGYREAGRDASRWYRTLAVLARLGLVTRGLHSPAALTDAGRAALNEARHE